MAGQNQIAGLFKALSSHGSSCTQSIRRSLGKTRDLRAPSLKPRASVGNSSTVLKIKCQEFSWKKQNNLCSSRISSPAKTYFKIKGHSMHSKTSANPDQINRHTFSIWWHCSLWNFWSVPTSNPNILRFLTGKKYILTLPYIKHGRSSMVELTTETKYKPSKNFLIAFQFIKTVGSRF